MESRESSVSGYRIVFLSLTVFPLVYLLLLSLLSSTSRVASQPDSTFDTLLPVLLLLIAPIEIGIAFLYFIPRALVYTERDPTKENLGSSFGLMVIAFVLLESVGIYGLLIGLLHIFVTGTFTFLYPSIFIGISFLASLYAYVTYVPRLLDFAEIHF